ncbi:hypothetical protein [Streptomyces sp. RKAG337]|uniref:hypothetical protein n=1 Tax=Streptomyces sp. RKAG337 TaxID=2893404 RepID=UPI002033C8DF|nr:hypothetical protein [Streptomyces sp. RKAG337]MCM2425094.1 hypothetical protein [Streptomyces sp. RKAG337]
MRSPTLTAAIGTTATALLLCGLSSGTAQADVGDVLIRQLDANGQTVCIHDYLVANLLDQASVTDPICPGATRERITNATLQPITDTYGPTTTTIQPFSTVVTDVGYNFLTQVVTFKVTLPQL